MKAQVKLQETIEYKRADGSVREVVDVWTIEGVGQFKTLRGDAGRVFQAEDDAWSFVSTAVYKKVAGFRSKFTRRLYGDVQFYFTPAV